MITAVPRLLHARPKISFPHNVVVGRNYLLQVDLRTSHSALDWPFEEEEYALTCMVDPGPCCHHVVAGDRSIVLNRFGGTFGPARFIISVDNNAVDDQRDIPSQLTVALIDMYGIPVFQDTLSFTISRTNDETYQPVYTVVQEITTYVPTVVDHNVWVTAEASVPSVTEPEQVIEEVTTPPVEVRQPQRVFISHSSKDNAFARFLAATLREHLSPESSVWCDVSDDVAGTAREANGFLLGGLFAYEIQQQVMNCTDFVVIVTEAAMKSKWVQHEIELAWARSPNQSDARVIVPVLRETCDVLPPLSAIQYVDFRPGVDMATAQRELLDAVTHTRTLATRLATASSLFDLGALRSADDFVGREADVEWILRRLTGSADVRLANIAAANGLGGIGKTALAAEVVRRLMITHAFPDGIVALDCRSQHSEVEALDLLESALSRFTDGRQKPENTDFAALGDVARRLLGGKHALVVFDNVEADLPASKLIAPLLNAGVAVLLTSRTPLSIAQGASLRLDLLPEDDALTLFLTTYGEPLGHPPTDAERAAARDIVAALGRHTLAVKLAAANAATQQRLLEPLAAEFKANPLRDVWLESSESAVRYVLESSVAAMSLDGQRLFAALGAFASADIGRDGVLAVAQSLGDRDPHSSLSALRNLELAVFAIDTTLPAGTDRVRLRLHPLTQPYARELFARRRVARSLGRQVAVLHDAESARVYRAIAAWYASYSVSVPTRALIPDEVNITGALDWALVRGDDPNIARICDGMGRFWRDTGRSRVGLRYLPLGAAAANRIADQSGSREDRRREADIMLCLGDTLRFTGRLPEAEAIYNQDLEVRRVIKDRQGEGTDLSNLGQVALARGALAEAAEYFQLSLALRRETQDRQGEGTDLSLLGQVALARGDLDTAAGYFQLSLALRRETQDRQGEGVDLSLLGQVALTRGQLADAAEYFEQSLPIRRETQDRHGEGADLTSLGRVALTRGQVPLAVANFEQALVINRETQGRQGEGTVLSLLGQVALRRGALDEAAVYFEQALVILHETQDRQGEGAMQNNLGQVALRRGQLDEAVTYFQQSLSILQETQDRQGEGVALCNLGQTAEARGQYVEAEQAYRASIAALRAVGDRINTATALELLGALLLQHSDNYADGVAVYDEAIALWQAIGLADREQAARDEAQALGYREDELPPPRQAGW